jgi:hypothetical protein
MEQCTYSNLQYVLCGSAYLTVLDQRRNQACLRPDKFKDLSSSLLRFVDTKNKAVTATFMASIHTFSLSRDSGYEIYYLCVVVFGLQVKIFCTPLKLGLFEMYLRRVSVNNVIIKHCYISCVVLKRALFMAITVLKSVN